MGGSRCCGRAFGMHMYQSPSPSIPRRFGLTTRTSQGTARMHSHLVTRTSFQPELPTWLMQPFGLHMGSQRLQLDFPCNVSDPGERWAHPPDGSLWRVTVCVLDCGPCPACCKNQRQSACNSFFADAVADLSVHLSCVQPPVPAQLFIDASASILASVRFGCTGAQEQWLFEPGHAFSKWLAVCLRRRLLSSWTSVAHHDRSTDRALG